MFLQKLSILNFKNYYEAELDFSSAINCFVGNNGAGKTNLLDAIHYLSMCKSYFNPVDAQNIRIEENFFILQGRFDTGSSEAVVYCAVKRNHRKQFKYNQKEYERLADHIGLLPLVMVTPNDSVLITEGSEERRKLLDSIISQYDKLYLEDLISYNKALAQRNALLKKFASDGRFDQQLLGLWDEQLIPLADRIFQKRKDFAEQFNPIFQRFYSFISDGSETAGVLYESRLHTSGMEGLLQEALPKDRSFQFTTAGIHKDDLEMLLNGLPVKKYASQGQQKSYILALKLAQFSFIREIKQRVPLLLLDDIFDKLDNSRVKKLMELISNGNFGQIFITDTSYGRVNEICRSLGVSYSVFEVNKGRVEKTIPA
jgi:DNA replication and repair protein RecF